MKRALWMTLFWICLALCFNVGVYFFKGSEAALNFLTGYLIEKSLSVDNLFVFILIFSYFKTPPSLMRKALFWGIAGAVIARGIFIFLGIELLARFEWILYVFGAFLLYTGIHLAFAKEKKMDLKNTWIVRGVRRFLPISANYEGGKLLVRKQGVLYATPLLLVILSIESIDIMFAIDSIPAILAITTDPFIVYTSNIFAILGLRELYFVLYAMQQKFTYLHYGIALILVFIGVKMILSPFYHFPALVTLAIVFGVLTLSILFSLVKEKK